MELLLGLGDSKLRSYLYWSTLSTGELATIMDGQNLAFGDLSKTDARLPLAQRDLDDLCSHTLTHGCGLLSRAADRHGLFSPLLWQPAA